MTFSLASALRTFLSLLGPSDRARVGATAALGILERALVLATAVALYKGARSPFVATSVVAATIFLGRRLLQGALRRNVRSTLALATVESLLSADLLGTRKDEDSLSTVFEGLYCARDLVANVLPGFVVDAIAAFSIAFAALFYLQPKILFFGCAVVALALVVHLAARHPARRASATEHRADQALYAALTDAVEARSEIVGNGQSETFRREVERRSIEWARASARNQWTTSIAGRAPALLAAALVGAAVVVQQYVAGRSLNESLGLAAVAAASLPAFVGLSRGVLEVRRSVDKLAPFLGLLMAERGPAGGTRSVPSVPVGVQARALAFAFGSGAETSANVFSGLTFDWKPGQILILSGANGSGKSTLLRLLLAMAAPTSGALVVGGTNLLEHDIAAWRRSIAYLPQRPYLSYSSSVRESVRLIAPQASDRSMQAALARVDLWSTLERRAEGDPLSIRVGTLSSGQRQRLALARLLCRKARFFVLDEPDANLDAAGVDLVAQLAEEWKSTSMVVIAAHSSVLRTIGDVVVSLESTATSK